MRPISRALRRGLTFFTLLLILELTPSGWCEAQCVTAPTQTSDTDCVVSFADGTFASQFFEPVNAVICGAAVNLCDSSASAMVAESWSAARMGMAPPLTRVSRSTHCRYS